MFACEGGQSFDRPAGFFLGHSQFVDLLQVEPEFRAGAEEVGQTQRGVTGYGALSVEIPVMRLVGTLSRRAKAAALMLSSLSSRGPGVGSCPCDDAGGEGVRSLPQNRPCNRFTPLVSAPLFAL